MSRRCAGVPNGNCSNPFILGDFKPQLEKLVTIHTCLSKASINLAHSPD